MARIEGRDLPNDLRIEYGLTSIYGIGLTTSQEILTAAGVDFNIRCKDLTDDTIKKIRNEIDKRKAAGLKLEGDLRQETALNVKRLQEIGSYRGIRHRKGLPVRGQNTKNNSRTRKGKRKTIANKKKTVKG